MIKEVTMERMEEETAVAYLRFCLGIILVTVWPTPCWDSNRVQCEGFVVDQKPHWNVLYVSHHSTDDQACGCHRIRAVRQAWAANISSLPRFSLGASHV